MENGATATYSGIEISTSAPAWVFRSDPTQAEIDEAVAVADLKIHAGLGFWTSFNGGRAYPAPGRTGWVWALKLDRVPSWIMHYDPRLPASTFNPDEGRLIDKQAKGKTARPGRWERCLMQLQGERALHKFIDGVDGDNNERASVIAATDAVSAAIALGDLPAAVLLALTAGLPDYQSDRLIGLLEDEMIYWPDFQREGSTSKSRTIAHHVPAKLTNSGTSLTISASVTTSGGATG